MTIASVKLTKNRGLMFYAVSLLNPLHSHNNLHASMKAIKHIIHPETKRPNIVIHVTDSIYAFNFMTENPELTYEDARTMARAIGQEWVSRNLRGIANQLDVMPV